jgi:hypothetical protein
VDTALIVAGVVAFLILDGFILFAVLRRHRAADDHGVLQLPGETTVVLPAGKASIVYQESKRTSGGGDDDIDFYAPSALVVTVTSPSGQPLEIKGPGFRGMGSSKSTGPGFSRLKLGSIQVTEPGPHMISAPAELPGTVDPKLLIGK